MKKIISLLCILCLMLSLLTVIPVSAAETADGLEYEIVDGEVTIIGYTGDATEVVIPDTIEGCPVSYIDYWALDECENLVSVTVPHSVVDISENAFSECFNLERIEVDSNNKAYSSVDGVLFNKEGTDLVRYPMGKSDTSYTIPDGVTSIADLAFSDCINLLTVMIPDGVTSIGYGAFSDCSGLTTITIPEGVTTINDDTFDWCTSLTSVTLPESVTTIGDWAFNNCESLISITIPESVISIGEDVFSDCESLTSITIPKNVEIIGEEAFYGCLNLKEINVDADNKAYLSADGVLFDKNKTTLIRYPQGKEEITYTIPAGTVSIEYCAFYNCMDLENITFADSVTSIADGAFYSCENLKSITLPENVNSIGKEAFGYCTSLMRIDVSENNSEFSSVDGVLFDKNKTILIQYPIAKSDVSYTIPEGVVSIGDYAFRACNVLTKVNLHWL